MAAFALDRRSLRTAVALLALAVGIAGIPGLPTGAPAGLVIVVADLSASVGPDPAALAVAALKLGVEGAPGTDRVAVVGFGTEASVLLPKTPISDLDAAAARVHAEAQALPPRLRRGSRLEHGVRAGLALAGGERAARLLVVGDLRVTEAARAQSVVMACGAQVPLEVRAAASVRPEDAPDLRIACDGPPPALRPGEAVSLRLRLDDNGFLGRRRVRIAAAALVHEVAYDAGRGGAIVILPVRVPASGGDLEVRIADAGGRDGEPANDAFVLPVGAEPRWSLAVFGPEAKAIAAALDGPSFRVAIAEVSVPTVDEIRAAELVVLADLSLERDFDPETAQALKDGLERGVLGLAVFGGPRAFRAGGYGASRVDSLLALTSRPPRGRDVRVLLDHSGSMEKDDRLGRAVEAVLRLKGALAEDDRLQVVPFATAPAEALPAAPTSPRASWAEVESALWKLRPRGGTRLLPAWSSLRFDPADTEVDRIVVIVSDFRDADLESEAGRDALRQARRGFAGEAIAVVLDPADEVLGVAKDLGFRVVPAAAVTPELLLRAVDEEAWSETPRELVFEADSPLPGTRFTVGALNRVLLAEGAVALARAEDRVVAATRSFGAGTSVAVATSFGALPVGDDVGRGLARLALPRRLTGSAAAERVDDGLRVSWPDAGARRPESARTTDGRTLPVEEVAPGDFVVRGAEAERGLLVLQDAAGAPIGRVSPDAGGDPEFTLAPRPDLSGTWVAGDPDAGARGRLRWPFAAAFVLLTVIYRFLRA